MATPAQRMNGVQFGPNDQSWYVAAFGALGNGNDDTAAIQAAVTFAQANGGGTVHLSNTTSNISAAIALSSVPIRIVGSHFGNSILKASASINAIFQFTDTLESTFFQFVDFGINGNSLANYGIISAKIDHSIFHRLRIQGTTTAALSIGGGVTGQGYDNDFIGCEIANNSGDGIRLSGAGNTNNIANIKECKIFLNTGTGIWSTGGAGLNIEGCTIETNLQTGIYLQLATHSARIVGNYFERNGTTGYVMTSPSSKTIKADIIVNGSTVATTMNFAFPCTGIEIGHNNSLATASASGFVYLLAANGVRVVGNAILDTGFRALIGTTLQGAGAAQVTGVNVESNTGPGGIALTGSALFNAEDATTSNISTNNAADWYVDSVVKRNYFSSVAQDYIVVSSNANTVAVSLSATTYNGDTAVEFSSIANTTDVMGQTIAVANYPELASQLVYFGAWVQAANAGAEGIALFATGPGFNSNSFIADTNWHFVQTIVQMPASGSVSFGFEKFGSTAGKIFIARPVVALVGAPYQGFQFQQNTTEVSNNLNIYGQTAVIGPVATSGSTLKSSGNVQATGSYWNGSAPVAFSGGFFMSPTSTTPGGQLVYYVNGVNHWVMNSNGVIKPVSTTQNIQSNFYSTVTQALAGTTSTTVPVSGGGVVLLGLVTATNVTTLTVTAGADGQMLDVHVIQPGAGTPATVPTTWTNVSFAGGTFTNTATLGKRDVVTLRYVNATSKWYEVSRTLNLTN